MEGHKSAALVRPTQLYAPLHHRASSHHHAVASCRRGAGSCTRYHVGHPLMALALCDDEMLRAPKSRARLEEPLLDSKVAEVGPRSSRAFGLAPAPLKKAVSAIGRYSYYSLVRIPSCCEDQRRRPGGGDGDSSAMRCGDRAGPRSDHRPDAAAGGVASPTAPTGCRRRDWRLVRCRAAGQRREVAGAESWVPCQRRQS